MCIRLRLRVFVCDFCASAYVSVCVFCICLRDSLYVRISVRVYLSVLLSALLSVLLSVCLSVSVCVCVGLCLEIDFTLRNRSLI